jgi:hypothetical protein
VNIILDAPVEEAVVPFVELDLELLAMVGGGADGVNML